MKRTVAILAILTSALTCVSATTPPDQVPTTRLAAGMPGTPTAPRSKAFELITTVRRNPDRYPPLGKAVTPLVAEFQNQAFEDQLEALWLTLADALDRRLIEQPSLSPAERSMPDHIVNASLVPFFCNQNFLSRGPEAWDFLVAYYLASGPYEQQTLLNRIPEIPIDYRPVLGGALRASLTAPESSTVSERDKQYIRSVKLNALQILERNQLLVASDKSAIMEMYRNNPNHPSVLIPLLQLEGLDSVISAVDSVEGKPLSPEGFMGMAPEKRKELLQLLMYAYRHDAPSGVIVSESIRERVIHLLHAAMQETSGENAQTARMAILFWGRRELKDVVAPNSMSTTLRELQAEYQNLESTAKAMGL